jgi:hypothetical protein
VILPTLRFLDLRDRSLEVSEIAVKRPSAPRGIGNYRFAQCRSKVPYVGSVCSLRAFRRRDFDLRPQAAPQRLFGDTDFGYFRDAAYRLIVLILSDQFDAFLKYLSNH